MKRLVLGLAIVLSMSACTVQERAPLRLLPEEGPPPSYAAMLTRARAQATAANEAFYDNRWSDLEEAANALEQTAKFLPKEAAAQVNLAGCLSVLGDHAAALAALDRAQSLKPGDAAIAHNKGRALEALGRLDEAEHAFNEALSIDHRLMPSLSARANLLAARGDWLGALTDLEMALTSRPNDPHLRLRRGELLLRQGDWLRGLGDNEARLELPGARYTPDLPRWRWWARGSMWASAGLSSEACVDDG